MLMYSRRNLVDNYNKHFKLNNKVEKYEDGKMYLRKMLAPLYNVHQLQHAFRLFGIEKEIIL